MSSQRSPVVVPAAIWRGWESRHHRRIDELTGEHVERRRRGTPHPVVDFLFTYYRASVGSIRRWHPGPELLLEGAHHTERIDWRHYRSDVFDGRHGLTVDSDSILERKGQQCARAREIVSATLSRPGHIGCFGLHEWAMLFESDATDKRHSAVPLRLSPTQLDNFVRQQGVKCTHFDAFRFFTPSAEPLNSVRLSRASQEQHEQPACLHAGMDLYFWATEMEAGAPGELVVECLRAAFDAREMDMRSSPYDLAAWGLPPVPIETAQGRSEFIAFQRTWIARTNMLRRRLLKTLDTLGGQPNAVYSEQATSSGTAPQ